MAGITDINNMTGPLGFNLEGYEEKFGPKQDLIDEARAEAEAKGLKYIGDASTWERIKEGIKQSPDLVANYALGSAAGISELLAGLGLAVIKGGQLATTTDPERIEQISQEPGFTKYFGKIREAMPTVDMVENKLSGIPPEQFGETLGYYTGPPSAAFALPGKIASLVKTIKPEAQIATKIATKSEDATKFVSTLNEKQLRAFNNYVDSRGKKGRANLINAIFEDSKLASDPFIRSNLATALNEKGIHNTVQSVKDTFNRAIRGLYLKPGEVISSKAKTGWGQSAEAASSEAVRYSQKFITKESHAQAQMTKKEKKIAEGRTREFDKYQDDEIVPSSLVDKLRKSYTWDKISQSLPDSPKKERIKTLIKEIREMNPKGTLHADHFIEAQSGGKDTPLNMIAKTETGHYGQAFPEGNFLSKTIFVKKINKLNKKIAEAWKNPKLKESIRNRTHIRVKEKDALYNSQIDKQGGTGHLFDAQTPGVFKKKGDGVVFHPNKLDPELQEILTVNNSYYGAGKSEFGKFTNAEDHVIDQLSRLKFGIEEMITTNFAGDATAYKNYVEKLKKTIKPVSPRAKKSKVGIDIMSGGGMVGMDYLTRPI